MTLEEKLRKIKHLEKDKTQSEWDAYKKQWIKDISLLQHIVMYKWFEDFSKQGLMEFDIIPTKRVDQYISEYLTTYLKITLANNKSFILSPVSGITTEYDGELEFYMQGNFDKKIGIFRKLNERKATMRRRTKEESEWIIAKLDSPSDHIKLNKTELENIINLWLS